MRLSRFAHHKLRYDLGRGILQNYLYPVVKAVLLFGGLVAAGRAEIPGLAWLGGVPLWMALLAGLAWQGALYGFGVFYVDGLKLYAHEQNAGRDVSPPIREIQQKVGDLHKMYAVEACPPRSLMFDPRSPERKTATEILEFEAQRRGR